VPTLKKITQERSGKQLTDPFMPVVIGSDAAESHKLGFKGEHLHSIYCTIKC
jgi:hypothetical protein